MNNTRNTIYNVYEAKTHLSSLLERVAKGEPIVIAKAGKPLAKLVPLDYAPASSPGAAASGFGESMGRKGFSYRGMPLSALSVEEVKKNLADDEVLVTRLGKPYEIIKLSGKPNPKRKPGMLQGKIWYTDDAFDPLADEELKDWYGEDLPPLEGGKT